MVSPADIACALVLFKRRFRLSISCMNHLLKLLPHIPPKLAPSSWHVVKGLLQKNNIISPPLTTFICSTCSQASSNSSICSMCGASGDLSLSRTFFQNFSISDQLHRIISRNYEYLNFQNKSTGNIMKDIRDGDVYRKLQDSCSDLFVTLSLNIDGIQPNKGSKKSIWPILFVINELPIKRRFSPENIILGGIWPGPKQPTRTQIALFLKPVIAELVRLEHGDGFFTPTFNSLQSDQLKRIRVYLIGACCDKPAQALIQNLPIPKAAFGCGRCELEGKS